MRVSFSSFALDNSLLAYMLMRIEEKLGKVNEGTSQVGIGCWFQLTINIYLCILLSGRNEGNGFQFQHCLHETNP